MDNEKKERIAKPMILFGTQLRGYKKDDVNRYIMQQSEQHLKEMNELEEQLHSLTEKLSAQEQEQTRVNAMLAQSDQIIAEQRTTLDEQKAKLQEQEAALRQMQQDVETCEAQINALAKTAVKTSQNLQTDKELSEKNKKGNEDFAEITQALQSAKDKIFRFLKK